MTDINEPLPKMFTEQEAAELMGISRWTLRTNRSKGRGIPYHRIGGRVYYRMDDIRAWFEGTRVVPSKGCP